MTISHETITHKSALRDARKNSMYDQRVLNGLKSPRFIPYVHTTIAGVCDRFREELFSFHDRSENGHGEDMMLWTRLVGERKGQGEGK